MWCVFFGEIAGMRMCRYSRPILSPYRHTVAYSGGAVAVRWRCGGGAVAGVVAVRWRTEPGPFGASYSVWWWCHFFTVRGV
jgi:hypothetical protein